MSEALYGVIIGGAIASIVPLITLFTNHCRWKRESKLEYLRSERQRLETLYSDMLTELSEAMKNDSYPSRMTSDILFLMPKAVGNLFDAWMMDDKNHDESGKKHAYMDICVETKKSLAEIDRQIKDVIGA